MSTNSGDIKFGTDGWRGIMAWDFTFDNVRKVAQAVADYTRGKPGSSEAGKSVVVGYDRRFLSDQFAAEIAQVLKANRLDVTLLEGAVPTQFVSQLTMKKFWLGLMVTASHNPPTYNGIKIKWAGSSAPDTLTAEVEALIGKNPPLRHRDQEPARKDMRGAYISYLKTASKRQLICSRLKSPIAVDFMNGCSAGIFDEALGYKKLVGINAGYDPLFGGRNPEPIEKNLAALIATVKAKKAAAGFAFDGDADRIGVVDDKGRYITPCQVFPILLKHLIENEKLGGKIVQCVSMGYLSKRLAREKGIEVEEVPVGFKHISAKMKSEAVLAGAEESGGYAWKGNIPDRDGMMTALKLLEIMAKSGKSVSELLKAVEDKYGKSCFIRRDFKLKKPVADKKVFAEKIAKKLPKKLCGTPIAGTLAIDGLKILLANDSWVLLRPSGTEPLMRTYAEADTAAKTEELLAYAAKLSSSYV